MTKRIILIIIGILIVGVLGYGAWKYTHPTATPQMPVPEVDVIKAHISDIVPETSFVAKIESRDKVSLRARITGFLQQRLFVEGDTVQVNQPLFLIERVNFEAAVREAEANFEKARANAKNATNQYERTKTLYKSKDVSKAKLDDAEAAYDVANADVARSKALLDLAQQDLEYTTIVAPMDGKIGESVFSAGELIGPNSGVLAEIVKVDPIDAVFSVSENQLLILQKQFDDTKETEAIFVRSDGSQYPQIGSINFVDVTLDEAMNTLKMKASFPNQKGLLISGQYGRVILRGKTPKKMLAIPQRAVQRDRNTAFVYVVGADNMIEKRTVTIGMDLPGFQFETEDGITSGEMIIVNGFQKINLQNPVQPNIVEQ